MGVRDRDYMRADGRPGLLRGHRVTWWLIGVQAVAWFAFAASFDAARGPFTTLQNHPGLAGFVYDRLYLHPHRVIDDGQVWQPLTHFWFHGPARLWPLLADAFLLLLFGRRVEPMLGGRRFLWLFVGAGALCGLVPVAVMYATNRVALAWGSSGAVLAVMACAARHLPYERIFGAPLPLVALAAGIALLGANEAWVYGGGLIPLAHLAGVAWGWFFPVIPLGGSVRAGAPGAWIVGLLRRRRARREGAPAHAREATAPRAEEERARDERARVDDLLAKIHAEGIAALSDEEKAFLQEASKRYK